MTSAPNSEALISGFVVVVVVERIVVAAVVGTVRATNYSMMMRQPPHESRPALSNSYYVTCAALMMSAIRRAKHEIADRSAPNCACAVDRQAMWRIISLSIGSKSR